MKNSDGLLNTPLERKPIEQVGDRDLQAAPVPLAQPGEILTHPGAGEIVED